LSGDNVTETREEGRYHDFEPIGGQPIFDDGLQETIYIQRYRQPHHILPKRREVIRVDIGDVVQGGIWWARGGLDLYRVRTKGDRMKNQAPVRPHGADSSRSKKAGQLVALSLKKTRNWVDFVSTICFVKRNSRRIDPRLVQGDVL